MPFMKFSGLTLLLLICWQTKAQSVFETFNAGARQTPYPAIVRLKIALRRYDGAHPYHVTEDCSGTLIDRKTGMIVTAWHCFDGSMDLTQPPKAWLQGAWQDLRLAANGGSMNNDWAIAHLIDPSIVDRPEMPIVISGLHPGMEIRMVGFQRADNNHDEAEWRQVNTACDITGHGDFWVESNCQLNEGASGGAVMRVEAGQEQLVGVISARSPLGSVWFVPLSKLEAYLSPP